MATSVGIHLDTPLLQNFGPGEISDPLKLEISTILWGQDTVNTRKAKDGFSVYLDFFRREIGLWLNAQLKVAIETHRDFLNLVQHLRTHRKSTRCSPEVLSFFPPLSAQPGPCTGIGSVDMRVPLRGRRPSCDETSVKNALDLTVCLWLMIMTGPDTDRLFTGRSKVEWPPEASLDDIIEEAFSQDVGLLKVPRRLWPKSFTARNFERICGIDISWTNNLADHLVYNEDSGTITVYHFASILQMHQSSSRDCVLPAKLLEETLSSLALLLPRSDPDSKRWLEKAIKKEALTIDPEAAKQSVRAWPKARHIGSYEHWAERLSTIADTFDKAEPGDIRQWWIDRRKKVQWSTFWVAVLVLILTIIFGIIGSVTGIMQVWAAYHPQVSG